MSTQSDAMGRVRKSERRYHISGLVILMLVLLGLSIFIAYLAQHSINEAKNDNNDKLIQIEKKIDDSDASNKRFYCSMVIQFLHSDQTIDDCVRTNEVSSPKAQPLSGASSSPQMTPVENLPTPDSSATPKDTSGEPSQAPAPPQKNLLQKAGSGIVNLVRKIGNLL